MIKANELRIGNLVEYKITDEFDEKKEWWEVSEIDADDIHWLSKVDTNDDDFRAIPLTEEWLLKCGFETIENNWKVLDCVYLKLSWERLAGFWVTFENESICLPHIKYLHQLQSLKFSLTNEELAINL
jgi:hypothetical protein